MSAFGRRTGTGNALINFRQADQMAAVIRAPLTFGGLSYPAGMLPVRLARRRWSLIGNPE
jgi:hypothetical protein